MISVIDSIKWNLIPIQQKLSHQRNPAQDWVSLVCLCNPLWNVTFVSEGRARRFEQCENRARNMWHFSTLQSPGWSRAQGASSPSEVKQELENVTQTEFLDGSRGEIPYNVKQKSKSIPKFNLDPTPLQRCPSLIALFFFFLPFGWH